MGLDGERVRPADCRLGAADVESAGGMPRSGMSARPAFLSVAEVNWFKAEIAKMLLWRAGRDAG